MMGKLTKLTIAVDIISMKGSFTVEDLYKKYRAESSSKKKLIRDTLGEIFATAALEYKEIEEGKCVYISRFIKK